MEWLGGNFPQRRAFAFYYRVLYRRSVGQRAIAARARARALSEQFSNRKYRRREIELIAYLAYAVLVPLGNFLI